MVLGSSRALSVVISLEHLLELQQMSVCHLVLLSLLRRNLAVWWVLTMKGETEAAPRSCQGQSAQSLDTWYSQAGDVSW